MIHEVSADEHIRAAQAAAIRRLAIGVSMEMDEPADDLDPPGDYNELSAPYCGCEICIVREVLDAAWPHILAAGDALIRENMELQAKYTDAVATIAEMVARGN